MEQASITLKIKNQQQKVNMQNKKYVGAKQQRKRCINKWRKRVIALVLAAGAAIGGMTAIEKMQSEANKAQNTKQAIVTANATEQYLETFQGKGFNYNQKINDIDESVQKYLELSNKENRTVSEETEYMEALKNICESRNDTIDIRETCFKIEIAQAYGITNPKRIAAIDFKYINEPDHNTGRYVDYIISVPNDEYLSSEKKLNKYDLDDKIKSEIEDIDSLSKYSNMPDFNNMTVEQLEKEAKEVYTYYNDIDYEAKYNVKETKGILGIGKGNLKTVKDKDYSER